MPHRRQAHQPLNDKENSRIKITYKTSNLEKEDIPEGLDYNECNLLNQEYVYSNIICYQEQQILLIMIKSLKEEINKTKNKKTEFNA